MKFKSSVLSMFIAIVYVVQGLAQIDMDGIKNELEKIIYYDTDIDFDDTPGFTIAIIDGDSSFVFDFGNSIHPDAEDIALQDIYEIGSVTKTMTASLITILEHKGLLSGDDFINNYIDSAYTNPRLDKLTINELVHHTSGFPKLPKYFGSKQKDPTNPYAHYSKEELLKFYSSFIPSSQIDFLYSHVNYALLELAIEKVTGVAYETALQKYIFDVLDMRNSFVVTNEHNVDLIVPGQDRAGRVATKWTFASFAGSEGVKANISDLVSYTRAHIGTSNTALDIILADNHNPITVTNFSDKIFVGTGWHVFDQKRNFDIVSHSGKTGGHRAYISFVKETKTGVIILSNSSIGTQDLGLLVLRMINKNWKRKL